MSHSCAQNGGVEHYSDIHTVWQNAPTPANSARQFGELHNVHAWALPFAAHRVDGFDLLKRVGVFFAGRPPYCQRATKKVLNENIEMEADFWESAAVANSAMLCHGWWMGGRTSRGRYYCNPDYTHRHPRSDTRTTQSERREFLATAASLGILDPGDVGVVFGFTGKRQDICNATTKVASRLDFPWSERRDEGLRRMARTWATLYAWGYSKARISRHFGVSKTHVVERTNWVLEEGFEPPTDPTSTTAVEPKPEPLMHIETEGY